MGLSTAIRHLYFEQFNPEITALESSVARLMELVNYQFNYVDKEEVGFESEHWLTAKNMIQRYKTHESLSGIFTQGSCASRSRYRRSTRSAG